MTEVEKAYLAGIVDGEGTVTLERQHRNETAGPRVPVANSNLKLLMWIKSRMDGNIIHKKKYKTHHKDAYAWSVRQDRAIRLLDEIKRYLIVKRPQADLITQKYKSVTHRAGKYSPKMLKRKLELVAKVRALNRR